MRVYPGVHGKAAGDALRRWSGRAGIAATLLTLAAVTHAASDQKGEALLAQATKAMQSAQTLSADMTESQGMGAQTMTARWKVSLKKPNLARLTLQEPGDLPIKAIIADGKSHWEVVEKNRYTKRPADPKGRRLFYGHDVVEVFFDLPGYLADLPHLAPRYAGSERVGGAACEVIEFSGSSVDEPALRDPGSDRVIEFRLRLYLTPERRVTRIVSETSSGGQTMRREAALANARWDAPLSAALFVFKPAKAARAYNSP